MALKPAYRRGLYVIIGIAVFLVVLPELIRFGARYGLTEFAAQQAEIEDIDLNLFTGRVGVTGLRIDYNDETTLTLGSLLLDIDMSALFGKQVLVEEIQLSNVNALVYEQEGNWVAVLPLPGSDASGEQEPEPETTPDDNPWKVGIAALALDNIALSARYQDQTYKLRLDDVAASDLFMWEPDKQASLMLNGALNDAPLNFDSGLKPFADPQDFALHISVEKLDLNPVNQFLPDTVEKIAATLSLDTSVAVQLQTDGAISITQDGVIALALDGVKASGAEASVRDLRWQGKVAVTLPPKATTDIKAQGEASVAGMQADYAPLKASARWESLSWNGDVNVRLPAEADPVLDLKGTLTLDELTAEQQTLQLAQRLASLQWQGTAAVDLADLDNSLQLAGTTELNNWQLEDKGRDGKLVSFGQLAFKELKLEGLNQITLAETGLSGLSALEKTAGEPGQVTLGDFRIQGIDLQDQHQLQVAAVKVSDLNGSITRTSEGKLAVLDDLIADLQQRAAEFESLLAEQQSEQQSEQTPPESNASEPQPETAAKTAAQTATTEPSDAGEDNQEKPPFTFAVGEISFAGDNQFTFTDLGVEPNVVHPVKIKALSLGKIDSGSQSAMTPLNVEMALYEHGLLKVSGEATPLQTMNALQANIKAEVKGIELPELSPYLEMAMGYHANSGQLNLDSKANIKQGQLDSETRVKILRMDLNPVDQALIDKMSSKLTMPVETALSVITDSDNTLSLTVPIKGDLSKPDIQLDRIIAGAMTQAVQNAAFTYFKYAVQPFGAIMLVSEKIGDMTLQAKFEPARFVPGTADIVAEQSGYLEKVAGMIKEKDDFSILVCVMVTEQDFQARENPPTLPEGGKYQWDEASETLAKSRLNTIKSSLMNDYGLSPDRVQSCRPQLGKGEPRAVMGI